MVLSIYCLYLVNLVFLGELSADESDRLPCGLNVKLPNSIPRYFLDLVGMTVVQQIYDNYLQKLY